MRWRRQRRRRQRRRRQRRSSNRRAVREPPSPHMRHAVPCPPPTAQRPAPPLSTQLNSTQFLSAQRSTLNAQHSLRAPACATAASTQLPATATIAQRTTASWALASWAPSIRWSTSSWATTCACVLCVSCVCACVVCVSWVFVLGVSARLCARRQAGKQHRQTDGDSQTDRLTSDRMAQD